MQLLVVKQRLPTAESIEVWESYNIIHFLDTHDD